LRGGGEEGKEKRNRRTLLSNLFCAFPSSEKRGVTGEGRAFLRKFRRCTRGKGGKRKNDAIEVTRVKKKTRVDRRGEGSYLLVGKGKTEDRSITPRKRGMPSPVLVEKTSRLAVLLEKEREREHV